MAKDGAARYFIDRESLHLGTAGHTLLAEWLESKPPSHLAAPRFLGSHDIVVPGPVMPSIRPLFESALGFVVVLVPIAVAGFALFHRDQFRFGVEQERSASRPWRFGLLYAALFVVVFSLSYRAAAPYWWMQVDEEQDFIMGATCAQLRGCPNFGNEMSQLGLKLPATNRYFLAAIHLISADPRLAFVALLLLHALGAVIMAIVADTLFGPPFGLLAGLWFGSHELLLRFSEAVSNGAFAPFFLTGALLGTIGWVRTGGAAAFLTAVTCITLAAQLHGTHLMYWPAFAVVAVLYRPPLSRPTRMAAAAIVVLLYAPWIWYEIETHGTHAVGTRTAAWLFSSTTVMERFSRLMLPLGNGNSVQGSIRVVLTLLGILSLALAPLADSEAKRARRAVIPFLLVPLVPVIAAGSAWSDRYGIVLVPAAVLAATAALASVWRTNPRARLLRAARPALAALLVVGIALAASPIRGWFETERYQDQDRPMLLAEQLEFLRLAEAHGFRTTDLESRVHGVPWDRWNNGAVYLGQWLLGLDGPGSPDEHMLIADRCRGVAKAFARWQVPLATSLVESRTVVGYRPRLLARGVELLGAEDVLWSSDDLPFHGFMAVYGDMGRWRERLDPRLAYPPEMRTLTTAWNLSPTHRMRLRAELMPGETDTTVTFLYTGNDQVRGHELSQRITTSIGGRVRAPSERFGTGMGIRERFLVRAAERQAALPVEVVLSAPGSIPPRQLDLYEEPWPPCELPDGS